MKKIFVATHPTEEESSYIDVAIEQNKFLVMHPFFNLKNEYGKIVQDWIEEKYEEKMDKLEDVVARDIWMIKNCDLFVYDFDSNAGFHLVGMAMANNKKMIGLSSNLSGVPEYFSRNFAAIIKPKDFAELSLMFC